MKLTRKNAKLHIVMLIMAVASVTSATAQCKTAVVDGINKLNPYSFNGQVNSVSVKAGKTAEIHLTFYKNRNYKLQINPEDAFAGKVSFRVLDENKKEVFNSKNGDQEGSWTFYSNAAQELIIEVTTTEKNKHCVVVLVGMQMPKNTNSIRDL